MGGAAGVNTRRKAQFSLHGENREGKGIKRSLLGKTWDFVNLPKVEGKHGEEYMHQQDREIMHILIIKIEDIAFCTEK